MEAISVLLFKPGFTVKEVSNSAELYNFGNCLYFSAIDEQIVWK